MNKILKPIQTKYNHFEWKTCLQYFEVNINELLHQRHGISYKDIK